MLTSGSPTKKRSPTALSSSPQRSSPVKTSAYVRSNIASTEPATVRSISSLLGQTSPEEDVVAVVVLSSGSVSRSMSIRPASA